MKLIKSCSTIMLLSLLAVQCFAANPIITHMFTADPSAHVWEDGKMWIYPSHDQDDATSYGSMNGHHVFSSEDLITWTDHGQIMHTDDISWARSGHLWAPDCAYKDGTYYYYYPVRDKQNKNRIGVATSDSPAGPFTDSGSYIEGTDEIDPACFVDDDGQAYLYWGGHHLRFVTLNDDMKSHSGVTHVELPNFYEGPWMHKRNGVYYLSYASGVQKPIVYCTSSSPTGPFTYRGVLMDAEVTGGATNHHSIVKFKGKWYIFYHNIALSDISCRRSVCVDRLHYNDDGTIKKVVQTKESVAPVPYNLALNKAATQSSTAQDAGPGRAIDGETRGKKDDASVTCTNREANAWWQVDLGSDYIIGDIKIWNAIGADAAAKFGGYTISVLDSNQVEVWSSHQTAPAERPTTVAVGGAIGRTIKVQLAGENALSLAEVEVIGSSIPILPEISTDLNIAEKKSVTASASSTHSSSYSAQKAFDGNLGTRWASTGESTPWLEVEFDSTVTVHGVKIVEYHDRIRSYKVQVYNESWETIFVGGNPSSNKTYDFPAVTGSKFRLQVTEATDGPTIKELELYVDAESDPSVSLD
ncbi:Xylosidase/arabinosidase [Novipirellula aureliae]|uniref:Xylosidase/arabinosidase n=1 Tax=Novipirellula aureliae TaxID=2527966 RepID=A0A5C6DNW7_9BACT|nr:family 43 glycosylhydrolase [Novipirellula aureliae]TWU37905.1 Xylosidase/arabinosidase [Novipirellula aureliae]